MPVYWMTLATILVKNLNQLQQVCSNFLWRGVKKAQVIIWQAGK